MPDLSHYTGTPPTPFAVAFIEALEAEGFVVASTAQGPVKNQSKTLCIFWRGIYIASMRENLWRRDVPYACVYRFPANGKRLSIAKAPPGFDKDAFARQQGCDPDRLHVNIDSGEAYLWVQDASTGLCLMRNWARRIDDLLFLPAGGPEAAHIEQDLLAILEDRSLSATERLAEVAVRLCQGPFRADLEREFGNACAATGLAALPVLRASHIVPWKHATNVQRRDPMNGLLLSANIDALFDRYMITFRPDGKLEVSRTLTQRELDRLGPLPDLRLRPCERRAAYLEQHNAEFERLERKRLACVAASA